MKTWTQAELLALTPEQLEGSRWGITRNRSRYIVQAGELFLDGETVTYAAPGFRHLIYSANDSGFQVFPCNSLGEPIDWEPKVAV